MRRRDVRFEVLDRSDMQGLLLRAYGELPIARYDLLEIDDPGAFKLWLRERLRRREITTAAYHAAHHGSVAMNLAFTASGLHKLDIDPEERPGGYDGFGLEFREGMTLPDRSRILGDLGDNDPGNWIWGGRQNRSEIDCVRLLFASAEGARAADAQEAWRKLEPLPGGAHPTYQLDAYLPSDGREHFGFMDGISQPVIRFTKRDYGLPDSERALHVVEPGEFILGYENGNGRMPVTPAVAAARDPHGHLGPLTSSSHRWPGLDGVRDFGRNGTFLVMRQLGQDVAAFRSFLEGTAGPEPAHQARLAARMIGRWPSGTPLTLSPEADVPMSNDDMNDFGYAAEDQFGFRCPLGAHIRRGNPRDSTATVDGQPHALRRVGFHRLLRRGRLYGPKYEVQKPPYIDDGERRGLMFVCLNADIRRQFEFVQQTWMHNLKFGGLVAERDPLLSGSGSFTIQRPNGPDRIHGLTQFVTVKGGAYFFMPGIRALKCLADAPADDHVRQ